MMTINGSLMLGVPTVKYNFGDNYLSLVLDKVLCELIRVKFYLFIGQLLQLEEWWIMHIHELTLTSHCVKFYGSAFDSFFVRIW